MAQAVDHPSMDLDYWQHRLETHQWTAQEMEAYRAGRLAGRLESALDAADRRGKRDELHCLPRAEKSDLYAQGYEAGLVDARHGRVLVGCCTRCQGYSDRELEGLRPDHKAVGPVTISRTGVVGPEAWWGTLTPTERQIAVPLLHAYPMYARSAELAATWGAQFAMKDDTHVLRVTVSRLRVKLQAVGIDVQVSMGYGYRLVVQAEGGATNGG